MPQQPDNLSVCFRAWGCAAATRASSLPTPSGSSPWLCCSLPSPISWDPRSAPMAPATGAPAWRMPRSVGYVCRPESASAGFQVTVTDTVQVKGLTGYACRVGQNNVGHLLSIAGTVRLPFLFTAWLNQCVTIYCQRPTAWLEIVQICFSCIMLFVMSYVICLS